MKSFHLFISDVHLSCDNDATARSFRALLHDHGKNATAIYCLGDIFDCWLGSECLADFPETIEQIRATSEETPIYFMHGNRDFLITKDNCEKMGMTLLPDPTVITLFEQNVIVTHGDLLCQYDKGYQRFRRFIQNPLIKMLLRNLPAQWKQRIAQALKKTSKRNKRQKTDKKMDVSPKHVEQWLDHYGASAIIHGHTHKPAEHSHHGKPRIVLGDWHAGPSYLIIDNHHRAKLFF